jgi:hypothetical protein
LKDQYFGDARDYLKYALLEELIRQVSSLNRLVCLWMLTAPDDSGEGSVPFVESPELPELAAFLHRHLQVGDRRVRHMRDYFPERGVEYVPWGDEPPYFGKENRRTYFTSIPDMLLRDALVFFDPDVGLSHGRLTSKHLSFEELAGVYRRMSPSSIAVVYQHRWRRPDFWEWMASQIKARLNAPIGYVADPSVAFYVCPRGLAHVEVIDGVLKRMASAGGNRSFSPVGSSS